MPEMPTFSHIYMLSGYIRQINLKMSHVTKINSKGTEDLNVRAKTIKLSENKYRHMSL